MSGVGFYFSTFILLRLLFLCFYGRKLDNWNEKKIGRLVTVILAQFYIPEICAAACCTNSDLLDNHLIKQNLQKIIHAARSLNCGNH